MVIIPGVRNQHSSAQCVSSLVYWSVCQRKLSPHGYAHEEGGGLALVPLGIPNRERIPSCDDPQHNNHI